MLLREKPSSAGSDATKEGKHTLPSRLVGLFAYFLHRPDARFLKVPMRAGPERPPRNPFKTRKSDGEISGLQGPGCSPLRTARMGTFKNRASAFGKKPPGQSPTRP